MVVFATGKKYFFSRLRFDGFDGAIMESKIGLKSTKVVSNDSNLELVHHEIMADDVCFSCCLCARLYD